MAKLNTLPSPYKRLFAQQQAITTALSALALRTAIEHRNFMAVYIAG